MTDLVVDPQIRTWVFLPIVIMTFLAGILRHYLTILLKSDAVVDLERMRESQALIRAQLLRRNGQYITKTAFSTRKNAFIKDNAAYLKEDKQQVPSIYNIAEDKTLLKETFVTNLLNYLPMLVIGSWLMYMLSGFILTKIPIPLTLRFKYMLQKDIFLEGLEAGWVSSASWYFLNVCGLRSIYYMILGENHCTDHNADYQYAAALPANANGYFKNAIEALIIYKHQFAVNCELD